MNGFVVYRGPSMIDGKPIVVIATGVENGGRNSKTGSMAQIYIIRPDQSPMQAAQKGDDFSICGGCKHRGRIITDPKTGLRKNVERTCYVTLLHGPRVVWDAFNRGVYPDVTPAQAAKLLAGKKVRVGAYGDPGAAPVSLWKTILAKVFKLNSYTHLWQQFPELAEFCMASCDNEVEQLMAKALGFRTYRVRAKGSPRLDGEGNCPASAELGKKVQCADCMLCGGNRTKAQANITIEVHGAGAKHFVEEAA
jgi:hypothetical protein